MAHLVAISGVHVTMFAWLFGALVKALWRRHPRAPMLCSAGGVARGFGLAGALGYALLAGWGVPAQRTVWMLAVWAALRASGARWSGPRVLAAAAAAVAVADPWALCQAGFWLSFCAVAVLMAQEPSPAAPAVLPRDRRGVAPDGASGQGRPFAALGSRAGAALRDLLRLQGLMSVVLAPVGLLFFQQVSVVGLLANLVAIPWVTLLVTPLALLGGLWPGAWTLGAWAVEAGMAVLAVLARWPGAAWHAALAPVWLAAASLVGGGLLAMPGPWRLRLLGLPLVAALAWPPLPRPAPGQLDLWAFDIGQGNAVLLRTRRHALLFDAGPKYWHEGDAGERVVVPQLRGLGVSALDVLVVSHRDTDHAGGAASVIQALPVHRVMSSLETGHPLRALVPHQPCVAGMRWTWDGVDFEILHPQADLLTAGSFGSPLAPPRANALSCVLSVRAAGRHVLLTGDIEAAQELALLDHRPGANLRAEVLLVPHHGSRTSSTPAFLAAVRPRHALVQAGYLNRYGHPAAEVVRRYEGQGLRLVRSDHCGAWHWRSDAEPPVCLREQRRRLWHVDKR